MALLIDTSLWIDLTRSRSPQPLKAFVAPYVNDPEARLTDPIIFELLRFATDRRGENPDWLFCEFP
jgi:predicted nucleic acid-binding protein